MKVTFCILDALATLFFFFLISKNDIYTKDYSIHEEHRANLENTRIGK